MPDGASENKVRSTRNSGDAYQGLYGVTTFPCRNYPRCGLNPKVFDNILEKYRKLLPKFHDMIDMSFLEDKSKASRHGWKESQKVLIRQKSAKTTI